MKTLLNIFALVVTLCVINLLSACAPQTGGTGATGAVGAVGPKGDVGSVGPMGSEGPIGLPGADAQSVTPIEFCAGDSSYPAKFLEYGLVIGDKVYGVYSANGGFWAYLPPGAYSSNAIGSSCNFTINADGTITH